MRKTFLGMLLALLLLTGCTPVPSGNNPGTEPPDDHLTADYTGWAASPFTTMQFNVDSLICNNPSIETVPGRVTITEAGTYLLSGKLENAQLVVDAPSGTVCLVLDGVSMNCERGPAILIRGCDCAALVLAEDTVSTITDGRSYLIGGNTAAEDAAICSNSDLVLTGSGSLAVEGNYSAAVSGRRSIAVTGGEYSFTAQKNGLCGREELLLCDGTLSVVCGGDAIVAAGAGNAGTVCITGGKYELTAGSDGIRAAGELQIGEGSIHITSGGGSANACWGDTAESWGLWGGLPAEAPAGPDGEPAEENGSVLHTEKTAAALWGGSVAISGGTLRLDSSDDAISSESSIAVSGGDLRILSGNDGIFAAGCLAVSGGTITVKESFCGISSGSLHQSGGTVTVAGHAQGIGIAGGADHLAREYPGAGSFAPEITGTVELSGGSLSVRAGDAGISSPGDIRITKGTMVVESDAMALQCTGSVVLTGGTALLLGSQPGDYTLALTSQGVVDCTHYGNSGDELRIATPLALLWQSKCSCGFSKLLFSTPGMAEQKSVTITTPVMKQTISLKE